MSDEPAGGTNARNEKEASTTQESDDGSAGEAEPNGPMGRLTLRLPPGLMKAVQKRVDDGIYPSRSAAIRQAIRDKYVEEPEIRADGGDDVVRACPECNAPNPRHRGTSPHGSEPRVGNPDDRYVCDKCGTTFNEVIERDRRRAGSLPAGGQALVDADPDDVLPDGGQERVCERCGAETERTDLSGAYVCETCQERRAKQATETREDQQEAIERFLTDGGGRAR